jgi:hypothetical protein
MRGRYEENRAGSSRGKNCDRDAARMHLRNAR